MDSFISKVADNIINPFILLLFGVAVVVFLWGVIQFVRQADNEDARAIGGRHILYGVIGMAIMISAFGILKFITGTFNLDNSPVETIEK